jgi:hypothetical protein
MEAPSFLSNDEFLVYHQVEYLVTGIDGQAVERCSQQTEKQKEQRKN